METVSVWRHPVGHSHHHPQPQGHLGRNIQAKVHPAPRTSAQASTGDFRGIITMMNQWGAPLQSIPIICCSGAVHAIPMKIKQLLMLHLHCLPIAVTFCLCLEPTQLLCLHCPSKPLFSLWLIPPQRIICLFSLLTPACFAFPGDGGHGYLKDWLWWAGLLTSK